MSCKIQLIASHVCIRNPFRTPQQKSGRTTNRDGNSSYFFHPLSLCFLVWLFSASAVVSPIPRGNSASSHTFPLRFSSQQDEAGEPKKGSRSKGDNLKWELARSVIRIANEIAQRTIIGLCKPALSVVIGPLRLHCESCVQGPAFGVLHPVDTRLCIPAGRKWWHALCGFRLVG